MATSEQSLISQSEKLEQLPSDSNLNKNTDKDLKNTDSSSLPSESEDDEPPIKKLDSEKLKKESKEKSHRDHDRHRSDKESSSRHREHRHHKSSSHRRSHKSHRHRDDDSDNKRSSKNSSRHKDSRSDRDSHRRHKDKHSDRHKKHRSKSVSSTDNSSSTDTETHRRNGRDSSRDRKYTRRNRSGSRDKSHYDRDSRKNKSRNDERNEKSRYYDKITSESRYQSRNNESKKNSADTELGAKEDKITTVLTNPDGTPNVGEILKSIKIPPELRYNQAEASKYQMEQLRLKTEELTGVKVPSFYSTTAVNPVVYAEQQKKRKLLWSKAKDNGTTTTSLVGHAIVQGTDGKTSEKFRKLMGLKSTDSTEKEAATNAVQMQLMHQKAFEAMDKEYELARMTTHTHRGQGLGFATTGFIDPNQPQKPTQ